MEKRFNAALIKQKMEDAASLEKSKKEFNEIKWERQDNDFTAKVGDYELSVKSAKVLDGRIYVWAVSLKDKSIHTEQEAKKAAEAAYFQHVNK